MPRGPESVAPTAPVERLAALDIIRGLALFGVLQINLRFYSGHIHQQWAGLAIAPGWGGQALIWFRDHLLLSKALFCFSMLFGIGLGIQMERVKARGQSFPSFAARRLGALALIGIAHATLVWNGDILFDYALLGLVLIPFLQARPRAILLGALAALVVRVEYRAILGWLRAPESLYFGYWQSRAQDLMRSANQAYGHGTWMEALRWRVWEWNHPLRSTEVITVVECLPLFLLGLALWRSGVLKHPEARIKVLRAAFHATFWFGLLLALLPWGWNVHLPASWLVGWRSGLVRAALAAGPLALAIGYFMGALLLLRRGWAARVLAQVAPMGRMALTNYLAQSLVCTWVFNAYGLGLWCRVSPAACILGGTALYLVQLACSRWWLARFKFGPVEWLWRSMTYGRLQPFRA